MADINVERKGGGPNFLPWILGLIVLGLLIWGLSQLLGRDKNDEAGAVATDSSMVTTDTVGTMGDPAATGTTAPMGTDSMGMGATPMTTGTTTQPTNAGPAGTDTSVRAGTQLTGAVDSAGGDTKAEGRTGNP